MCLNMNGRVCPWCMITLPVRFESSASDISFFLLDLFLFDCNALIFLCQPVPFMVRHFKTICIVDFRYSLLGFRWPILNAYSFFTFKTTTTIKKKMNVVRNTTPIILYIFTQFKIYYVPSGRQTAQYKSMQSVLIVCIVRFVAH